MFLAKIKDNFMFNRNSSNDKSHWYVVYSSNNKVTKCYQLTHLYKPDKKRFGQLKKGLIKKVYIKGFDTPFGLKKRNIQVDINGNKLTKKEILNNSTNKIYGRNLIFKKKR